MTVIEYNDLFYLGRETDLTEAQTQAGNYNPSRTNPLADYGAIYLEKHCIGPYKTCQEAEHALDSPTWNEVLI